MQAGQVITATLDTLRASADRLAALLAEVDDERERRNRQVVALVDAGEKQSAVAIAARVSPKSVCVILGDYG